MVSLKSLYNATRQEIGDLEARWLLEDRCNIDQTTLITQPDFIISEAIQRQIQSDVEKRKSGVPLSKVIGWREFYGRRFYVNEDVLDPRPDTEVLIERVLNWYKLENNRHIRILDIGTGSGCIALTLLNEIPNSSVVATDISEKALFVTKRNAKELATQGCHFSVVQANWYPENADKFDLIVSNPPYINSDVIPCLSREVKNHDPLLALDGGLDGLEAYKKILEKMKNYLAPDGRAFFEIGYDQELSVSRLVKDSRFEVVNVHRDYAENPRVVEISSGDK